MQMKAVKDSDKYQWTEHSKFKMQYYGISQQRVLRVIRAPQRIETGIVENTIAAMQPSSMKTDKEGKRTWGQEIWVMYQIKNKKPKTKDQKKDPKNRKLQEIRDRLNSDKSIRIISAWKYPGVTSENDPIPEEILREIAEII